jgi:hypothetical protein
MLVLIYSPLFAATQTKPHSTTPAAAVSAFYQYHFANDMGFSDKTFHARAKWFTPEAQEAARKYFAMPEIPDEAPYIEGDPFTGSQEYPSRFSVGTESIAGKTAQVPVIFTWNEDDHSISATVVLKHANGEWLIDDVTFPDQDSFRKLLADALNP